MYAHAHQMLSNTRNVPDANDETLEDVVETNSSATDMSPRSEVLRTQPEFLPLPPASMPGRGYQALEPGS